MDQEIIKELPKTYSGKLLLKSEIPLKEPLFQELLRKNYFKQKTSIVKSKWTLNCLRCNNEKPHLFAKYPCIACKKKHYYCRNCINMGRVSECEYLYKWTGPAYPRIKHKSPCSWSGKLTPHQEAAADKIVAAIKKGNNEHLIWAVCGSGKTEMLFPGLTKSLQLGKRICIATPRTDVVRELLPRLKQAFTNLPIQGLYGGSEDKDGSAQLIISTTHQLLRFKSAFDVIIIDEIDAFPFHADSSLPYATRRSLVADGTMIYLTATPRKEQERKIRRGKLPHTFVPLRYHNNPLPLPKFISVFNFSKQMQSKEGPNFLIHWLKRRENNARQVLIFLPTIKMADLLLKPLKRLFLKEKVIYQSQEIESVHSEDPDRSEKIMRYRRKEIKILLTTTILERGVTFPSVDVLVLDAGHSVFDEAALVQIAGRAGRSADDPRGEVVFFHDGRTRAMIRAKKSIHQMNLRAGF